MNSGDLELTEGTLRQRRNLFLISILLIVIHHAEIELGEVITFQGLTLNIGNPSAITLLLQFSLAYFLWRFYQYFNSDKAYSNMLQQYRDSRNSYLNRAVHKSLFKRESIKTYRGSIEYNELNKADKKLYILTAERRNEDENDFEKITVKIPSKEIEPARIKHILSFLFRGKILTDFYVPFLLASYAAYVQIV